MLVFKALALLITTAYAIQKVPQVKLCEVKDCPSVSRVVLGTLHLGDRISGISSPISINKWIRNGVNLGINTFDLADVYPVKGGTAGDSATLFGQALALTPGLREHIVIVAKMDIIFEGPEIDTSKEHLDKTLNWFLSVLGTDYIDIVLLHYPNSFMNAKEVAETFNDWKIHGKVRSFGTSNHYPSHRKVLQKQLDIYNIQLVTNEIEVSVWNPSYLNYDSSLMDDAQIQGYRVLGWGGIAGDPIGGLNRLFVREGTRQDKILGALSSVGNQLGTNKTDVIALAWTLSHPAGIVPLIGSTNMTRVSYLMEAFDYVSKMTSSMWWTIGRAGGLCPLADSQCNYELYMASNLPPNYARVL